MEISESWNKQNPKEEGFNLPSIHGAILLCACVEMESYIHGP
jgi:hypothetical protein